MHVYLTSGANPLEANVAAENVTFPIFWINNFED